MCYAVQCMDILYILSPCCMHFGCSGLQADPTNSGYTPDPIPPNTPFWRVWIAWNPVCAHATLRASLIPCYSPCTGMHGIHRKHTRAGGAQIPHFQGLQMSTSRGTHCLTPPPEYPILGSLDCTRSGVVACHSPWTPYPLLPSI